jgi:hypothetical protein
VADIFIATLVLLMIGLIGVKIWARVAKNVLTYKELTGGGSEMKNLTLGELVKALQDSGMSPDSDVRCCLDPEANDTAGVGEVSAGCDGILLTLNVDEIG